LNNTSRTYAIVAVVLSLLFVIWSITLIRSVKQQRDDVSNHVAAITQINAINHAILELQTVYLEDKYHTNSNWESGLETYTKTVNNFRERNASSPEMADYIYSLDSIVRRAVLVHLGIYRQAQKSEAEINQLETEFKSELNEALELNDITTGVIRKKLARYSEELAWKWTLLNVLVLFSCILALVLSLVSILNSINYQKRKKAMIALRAEKDKAQSYLDMAGSILVVIDRDQNISMLNKKGLEMIGLAHEEEVIGRNAFDYFASKSERDALIEGFKRVMKGETDLVEYYERKVVSKNGEERIVGWHNSLLEDMSGHIIGVLSSGDDVTEKKFREKALKETVIKLEKSNEQLEGFAYMATHDLRAPVANLIALLNLYNKENPEDEENKFIFQKFEESVKILNNTLGDLIDIVAVNKNKFDEKIDINIEETLIDVMESVKEDINKSGIVVSYDFSKCNEVSYPSTQFRSILINMLTNAIKYRSHDRKAEVSITSSLDKDFVCLRFADNGLGIDLKKYGGKLFQMNKRFHLGTEGKGIGLFIIKSQVEAMGGKVMVESEPGKGTVFSVYIKK
jgi:PAS domain S-box-containing protein